MRLFRRYTYRLSRQDTAAALFERATEVVREVRGTEQPVRFYFRDQLGAGMRGTVSALSRVYKRFPELQRFSFTAVEKVQHPLFGPDTLSSNLPQPWQEANVNGMCDLVPTEVLLQILQGVPRAFPFAHVTVICDEIDWLGDGLGYRPPAGDRLSAFIPLEYLRSSLSIQSNWWTSRREVNLSAVVEVEPPALDAPTLPELPERACKALDRLGKRHWSFPKAAASPEEQAVLDTARQSVQPFLEGITANVQGPLEGIPLPHALPPEPYFAALRESVSVKVPVLATFKPRGYRHLAKQSAQGTCRVAKRTPNHNLLQLSFDAGTWAQAPSAVFAYRGPLWFHSVWFAFRPGQRNPQYPTPTQELMDQVIANAGGVVDYLERTVVPVLDEAYGPAPAWFEYEG
ncbi:MAG: hypothetical protein FJX75_11960 [Armatimonadetes bacterium]|nr:hypothetical protein [Armatimonadota bacterium]